MSCETNNIVWNIPHIQIECGEYFANILSIPHNIVMDLNNGTHGSDPT